MNIHSEILKQSGPEIELPYLFQRATEVIQCHSRGLAPVTQPLEFYVRFVVFRRVMMRPKDTQIGLSNPT